MKKVDRESIIEAIKNTVDTGRYLGSVSADYMDSHALHIGDTATLHSSGYIKRFDIYITESATMKEFIYGGDEIVALDPNVKIVTEIRIGSAGTLLPIKIAYDDSVFESDVDLCMEIIASLSMFILEKSRQKRT
ncbi:MAG: hypothetical protein IKS96_07445 [Fibrobacter sp.]|nr:hypothetical protein [Fibrobacter sp.]